MPQQGRFHAVSLGVGSEDLLTVRACDVLSHADIIYMPAKEKSWMKAMADSVAPDAEIVLYMPASTKWGEMETDPVHKSVAESIAEKTGQGKNVCFACAGDVSIYSPYKYLEKHLAAYGIKAEIVPGVSFLNGAALASGTPLVWERSNLLAAKITDVAELDVLFRASETIVLYDTDEELFPALKLYARENSVDSMQLLQIGVRGNPSRCLDLLNEDPKDRFGLIVLEKNSGGTVRTTVLPPSFGDSAPFEDDIEISEGTYPAGDASTRLKYTMFRPHTDEPLPVLVLFHGGAWETGSRDQFFPQAKILAELGTAVLSMDYRIKSTHGTTPLESVADARAALEWVLDNAAALRINPDRIALGGGSAGGHIAACCAAMDDEEFDPNDSSAVPRAMVLFNPVTDTGKNGFGFDRIPDSPEKLNVLSRIKPGFPPTAVFHGVADTVVPFMNSVEFDRTMKEAGNMCRLFLYEGKPHGFFNHGSEGSNALFFDTLEKTVHFLADTGFLPEQSKKIIRRMKNDDQFKSFVKSNNQIAVAVRQSSRKTDALLKTLRNAPPPPAPGIQSLFGAIRNTLLRLPFMKRGSKL